MAGLTLRARVITGFIVWTIGIFVASHVFSAALLFRFPSFLHGVHGVALFLFGFACLVAGFTYVQRGLRPVQYLRARLARVRDGQAAHVDGDYPAEIQPLVSDLNALLDHRDDTVRRALGRADDLAHALKTPLAVLAQAAERAEALGQHDLAETLGQQVERMRRQIDSHLAHARAAASGATAGGRGVVVESVDGLVRALSRLHAERGLRIEARVPDDHIARCRRQDLDEMIGNLLDNACQWARALVVVESRLDGSSVAVTVDDDGPGLEPAMRERVLLRGVQGDEASPGSGLGLAIARDLAALHGGTILLGESRLGGLQARLVLPAAGPAAAP